LTDFDLPRPHFFACFGPSNPEGFPFFPGLSARDHPFFQNSSFRVILKVVPFFRDTVPGAVRFFFFSFDSYAPSPPSFLFFATFLV